MKQRKKIFQFCKKVFGSSLRILNLRCNLQIAHCDTISENSLKIKFGLETTDLVRMLEKIVLLRENIGNIMQCDKFPFITA